ncbi:hypothetical protein OESDEN_07665 [Oesophagostomum dentatum]|uniref:Uncharacterized protein n=1 Tax=Oesophagostomum dentatum TaxID=61180 RepID=A0A0B1T9F7_OESDE|nr:hypothetical protein OESDEN_07665 [Oesophagostomum dentatum]
MNLRVKDYLDEQHSIVCRNKEWIYTGPPQPLGKAVSKIACYEMAITTDRTEPKHIVKARSPPTCKRCSAITNDPNSVRCPQDRNCSEPIVKNIETAANCETSVVECPGSDLMIQLKSGSSMIVYSQDVRCDGEWTFDDGHLSHPVENMLCLSSECCRYFLTALLQLLFYFAFFTPMRLFVLELSGSSG